MCSAVMTATYHHEEVRVNEAWENVVGDRDVDLLPLMHCAQVEIDEEDKIVESWNPCLYSLQLRAPKARALLCQAQMDETLEIIGKEYHGLISKADAVELLWEKEDGTFLVRKSAAGKFILSFKFDDNVFNYSIQFDGSSPIYDDKTFTTIEELLNDSLITLYIEKNENINKQLSEGRKNQRNSSHFSRKYDQRQRRKARRLRSKDSSHGSDCDLTDGVSPTISLSSLNDPTLSPEHENRVNLRRKGACRLKGSTKSASSIIGDSSSQENLEIPRTFSSGLTPAKRKAVSVENLLELEGALANLVRSTLTVLPNEETQNTSLPASRSSSESLYEKAHKFTNMTYKAPTWCDICHHFLWGIVKQGLTCQDCGINVHKQCMDTALLSDCIPSRKMIKRVFGVDLTTLVMLEGDTVPSFVNEAIKFVESDSLDTEGLYRLSGTTSKVLEIKDKVDEGESIKWEEIPDVAIVTGALKLFFRELPIPLISYNAYPIVIEAVRDFNGVDESAFCDSLKQILLENLPKSHYVTLRVLISHLCRVVEHSEKNKMLASNLAVVFSPTLMKSICNNDLNFTDLPYQQKLLVLLMNNFNHVFVE